MDTDNAFVFLDTTSSQLPEIVSRLGIRWLTGEKYFVENSNLFTSFKLLEKFNISGADYCVYERSCVNKCSNSEYKFAFAVMSSGSTGEPKIIKVQHDSIVPNILDLKYDRFYSQFSFRIHSLLLNMYFCCRNIYKMVPEDVIYLTTPLTFDPCIVDLFLAFHAGASILLPSRELRFDTKFSSDIFTSITIWFTTPSLFVKCFPKVIERSNLRILVLGGEQFPCIDYQTWPCLQNVKIFNIYGITEVSCWASVHFVENLDKPVPLGSTLSDTIFQIRSGGDGDADCVGELFIGNDY